MRILKKSACFLLAALLLALCGCNSNPTSSTTPTTQVTEPTIDRSAPLSDGKTLKLLAITSSFGLNTTQLLYDVAIAEGCTDVVVGRLYASGCTLKMHAEWAASNNAGYQYTKISDGSYQQKENYSLQWGLQDEDVEGVAGVGLDEGLDLPGHIPGEGGVDPCVAVDITEIVDIGAAGQFPPDEFVFDLSLVQIITSFQICLK